MEPNNNMGQMGAPGQAEPMVSPTPTLAPDVNAAPAKPREAMGLSPEEKAKRKRLWTIIGSVVGGLVAICIIAIVAVVMNRPVDATVTTAVNQLLAGGTPSNVKVTGEIEVIDSNEDDELKSLDIMLDAVYDNVAAANTASAEIEAELKNGNKFSMDLNEVQVTDGDVYFRVKDFESEVAAANEIDDALNCLSETEDEEAMINCVTEDDGEAASSVAQGLLLSMVEAIDGEWLRVSNDDTNMSEVEGLFDNISVCTLDMLGGFSRYSNSIKEIYNQNPFVTDETKTLGVAISPLYDEIYRLGLDWDLMKKFEQGLSSTSFAKDWASCTGGSFTTSDLFEGAPTLFVEIDENHNFTRVFFDGTLKGGEMIVRFDLSFSYPTTVTVNEPEDYTNLSDALTEIIMKLFYNGLEIE